MARTQEVNFKFQTWYLARALLEPFLGDLEPELDPELDPRYPIPSPPHPTTPRHSDSDTWAFRFR